MILIRSILFFIFMPVSFVFSGLIGLPLLLTCNARIISLMLFLWGKIIIFLLKFICKVDYKITGEENSPKMPSIIASRHQSTWETAFLMIYFNRPAFILKRELLWLPIFGWYLIPAGMISIDRTKGTSAIKQIIKQASKILTHNHIVIFPEGTRTNYGHPGKIQSGILAIHNEMPEVPIVPITLDSGKYWNKKSWLIKPGTVNMQINKPIHAKNFTREELIKSIELGIAE